MLKIMHFKIILMRDGRVRGVLQNKLPDFIRYVTQNEQKFKKPFLRELPEGLKTLKTNSYSLGVTLDV